MSNYMNNQQLIVITGARNTGKTTLAWTYLPPSQIKNMYIHDSEKSGNRVLTNLEKLNKNPGKYVSLGSRFNNLPKTEDLLSRISSGNLPWVDTKGRDALIEYYEYILNDLDKNLEHGKYKVYIHDTIEKLEAGMAAWTEANKKAAGVTTTAYGKLWSSGVFPLYENFIEALFNRGIETVILTSHLKNPWEGNRPVPGKVAPSGKKILYRLSSLMLWLVNDRSNQDGAPAGLVIKERMGNLEIDSNDEWKIKRMLPERVPHCTWQDISKYLANGCDLANPAPGEKMSPQEREMISELLTDEQMKLMILAEEKEIQEMKTQGGLLTDSQTSTTSTTYFIDEDEQSKNINIPKSDQSKAHKTAINLYVQQGLGNSQIASALNIPLPEVLKVRKELGI